MKPSFKIISCNFCGCLFVGFFVCFFKLQGSLKLDCIKVHGS